MLCTAERQIVVLTMLHLCERPSKSFMCSRWRCRKTKKRQEREGVCPSKEEISKISRNPPGSWEVPETPMIQDKGWLDLIQLPLKSLGGLSFQRYARNVGVLDVTRRVSGNGSWRCPTRGTSPACDVNADGNPKNTPGNADCGVKPVEKSVADCETGCDEDANAADNMPETAEVILENNLVAKSLMGNTPSL